MNDLTRLNSALQALILVCFGILSGSVHSLEAGAASAVITPDEGSYLAGYGRDRQSTGVYDDVFVKAVVIRDETDALAIVVVDCIGLLHDDVQRIRQRVQERLGAGQLDPERIIVTSTHTHAGPDVAGLWGSHIFSSGRDEGYISELVNVAAEQIAEAYAASVPVEMKVGSALLKLSWVKNLSEPGLLDHGVTAIQLIDEAGRSVATLTNFPCHPTVLDGDNHLVSADYVGGFYQAMDQRFGGVNVFLQGAIGGWVQPEQGDRSIELARDYGELLALVSERLLEDAERLVVPTIAFAATTFDIPLENWGFKLLMFVGVLDRETYSGSMRTETAWFSIGGVQFATHPGETSPAYSLATRELMGNPRHSMILGLGLDALGYMLRPVFFEQPEEFPHADYLTTVSVGPEAAPRLMAALAEIIPDAVETP
jgi:hypothetical protein